MTEIIFATSDKDNEKQWLQALQRKMPFAQVRNMADVTGTSDAEIGVTWLPPDDFFVKNPRLKIVFNLGAGVDAVLNTPALPDDLVIVRLEDAGMAVQIAEYAVYAVLRISRRFNHYEEQSRQGVWKVHPDIQRSAWPVGVMGLGVMGTRIASSLAAFDYPVAGWSRSRKEISNVQSFAGQEELGAFLQRTRVLVNVLPMTPATVDILNRETLGQLQPQGYLVNVGRGEHVVDDDLVALIRDGVLAGAMLDVFRQEPLPPAHPFWKEPDIVITPHIAAASLVQETVEQIGTKIEKYINNEPLTGLVDRSGSY